MNFQATAPQQNRKLIWLTLLSLMLCSCGLMSSPLQTAPRPQSSFLTTSDGKRLSLQHWNLQNQPETVLLGLHGLEGAAEDFANLGQALAEQSPQTTLYALNLRGAGYDEDIARRGDIRHAGQWVRDLLEFHSALQNRHPQARIMWVGESMGALITLKAAAQAEVLPAGLVLVSPVVSLEAFPSWQVSLLRLAAWLLPEARVSLATLAGGSFQATDSSNHFNQIQKNPYHVGRYTLRFLATLANLSQGAQAQAQNVSSPTLILHGAKDNLNSEFQLSTFANYFSADATLCNFHHSHHLLFYDKERHAVVSKILTWVEQADAN